VTDPNAQEKKPAGSKPAEPTSPPPGAYLSPRLREKLESTEPSSDDWPPKGASVLPSILIGVAVVAVLIGGFMGWRSIAQKQNAKAMAAAAAHADSVAAAAKAESLAIAARADSAAVDSAGKPGSGMAAASGKPPAGGGSGQSRAAAQTASAHSSQPSGGAGNAATSGSTTTPAAAATPAPPTDGYGIDVGTFLLEDRAQGERDRLSQSTGLAGLVDATADGYRVILGKFRSRGAAEKRAAALADSGQVREAHVVPRPK
jgi:hypothetical protein